MVQMRNIVEEQNKAIPFREFYNRVVIFSIIIFTINNWWLKYEFHNWITGKLSDVLFCFFFPIYCSAILSIFTNWKIIVRMWVGISLTLASFVAMKTSPIISTRVSDVLSIFSQASFGQDSHNVVDQSDLIATPVVICSLLFALSQKVDT